MSRWSARLALGLVAIVLLADGCGGGGSSSTGPSSQTPAGFDFGQNDQRKASAFGDSITLGVLEQKRKIVLPILVTGNNYPALLEGRLRSLDSAWRVVNRGRPGEEVRAGASRLPSVLTIDKPGFVLLMEGTNDATDDLSPSSILASLEAMVLIAQGNKTIPILATIPPNFRNDPSARDIVSETNVLIRAMARSRGVALAEMFEGMNDRNLWGLSPDRDPLHPNEAGYQRMAGIWFEAMRRAVPRAAAPAPAPAPATGGTGGGTAPSPTPPTDGVTAGQKAKAPPPASKTR